MVEILGRGKGKKEREEERRKEKKKGSKEDRSEDGEIGGRWSEINGGKQRERLA